MNIGSLEVLLGVNTAGLSRAAVNMRRFESQVLNSNATMQASLRALGSQMMLTGTLLTQYLTVPIVGLSAVAVTSFAKYERELSKIAGLTGVSSEQTRKWGNEILDLTSKVAQSPMDLVKGMYFISSSGFRDAKEGMNILDVSAKAATVGLGEVKTVADAVTSVLNAYGTANITAAQATDVLITAVREGKGEAEALTRVIGHVMPLAVQLGVSFDQVAGGLASLTLTGKSASEAATQMARLFTTLIQAPPRAEKALEGMGISFAELRRILREGGLLEMIKSLKGMVNENTLSTLEGTKAYEDNIQVLGDVFTNIRALLPVLDMVGPNFANTARVLDATAESSGALKRSLEAVKDSVWFRWTNAIDQMKVALIKFGDTIKNPVIELIQKLAGYITSLSSKFAQLPAATQQNILRFLALSAVLGPLLIILGQVVGAVRTLFSLLLGSSLASTVGQFIALAAAIYYTYKNWDLLKEAWNNFEFSTITDKIQKMIDKFYEMSPERITRIKDQWEQYMSTVKGVEELQSKLNDDQKQYETLTSQLTQAKSAEELEATYVQILRVLEDINTVKAQIVEKDKMNRGIQKSVGIGEEQKEFGRLSMIEQQSNGLVRNMQKNAEKIKDIVKKDLVPATDKVGFDDFFKKVFSDVGSDLMSGVAKIQKMITGIDFGKIGGGFGVGNLEETKVLGSLKRMEKAALGAMKIPTIKMPELQGPDQNAFVVQNQKVEEVIRNVDKELAQHANLLNLLGVDYDKAAADASTLQDAISKMTSPEMASFLSPKDINLLQQYLALFNKLQTSQKANTKELQAWRNVLSSIGTFMGSISKYMSQSFQETFNVVTDVIQIFSELLQVIKAFKVLIAATTAIEEVSTATKVAGTVATAAGIPVTLAAAAAEQVKAAASTEAAVAGAASSVSWIPIVGIGLALAGIVALGLALNSASNKRAKLANGGTVPNGFPNDSFPAMLTSGETVIPLNKMGEIFGNVQGKKNKPVVFKIHRKELVGILEEAGLTNNSF